jgi:hypothetical protein
MRFRLKGEQITNNRKHVRMPGNNKAAVICASDDQGPIMCTVADISNDGAGLTFVNIDGIPNNFKLTIKGEMKARSCKVAWKKEPHRMGVAFEPDAEG